MYGSDIFCMEFQRYPIKNFSIHRNIRFLYNVENSRALRIMSWYALLKPRPRGFGHSWFSLELTGQKSTLVQVIFGSRNCLVSSGSRHYPSQCWPRSVMPYGITRPQWVNEDFLKLFQIGWWLCPETRCNILINSLKLSDTYMLQQIRPSLVQIMACCLAGTKPLSESVLKYC